MVLFIKELARLKFVARLFIQGKASFDNFLKLHETSLCCWFNFIDEDSWLLSLL